MINLTPVAFFNTTAALLAVARPTSNSWTETASYGTHANDGNAYDIDGSGATLPTTYANLGVGALPRTSPGASYSQQIYTGFGTGTVTRVLKVYITTTTEERISIDTSNDVFSNVQIYYSKNGGSTWTLLGTATGGVGDFTYSTPLTTSSMSVDVSQLQVKIIANGSSAGTTINSYAGAAAAAKIYDIRFE